MSFPSSKKPPFEKRTSIIKRQNQGLLQKSRLERYLELLTRINYSKMPFSSSKKTPFEKTTSMKRQSQGCFYRKVVLKDIWNF